MVQREHDSTESLLQELLWTYGPCGQEEAVRTVCARELQPLVDDVWTDDAGNLIGYIGADDAESRDHRHRSSSIAGGAATWHTWMNCPCWSSGSNPTARYI